MTGVVSGGIAFKMSWFVGRDVGGSLIPLHVGQVMKVSWDSASPSDKFLAHFEQHEWPHGNDFGAWIESSKHSLHAGHWRALLEDVACIRKMSFTKKQQRGED